MVFLLSVRIVIVKDSSRRCGPKREEDIDGNSIPSTENLFRMRHLDVVPDIKYDTTLEPLTFSLRPTI
jgi:hypothetical protein